MRNHTCNLLLIKFFALNFAKILSDFFSWITQLFVASPFSNRVASFKHQLKYPYSYSISITHIFMNSNIILTITILSLDACEYHVVDSCFHVTGMRLFYQEYYCSQWYCYAVRVGTKDQGVNRCKLDQIKQFDFLTEGYTCNRSSYRTFLLARLPVPEKIKTQLNCCLKFILQVTCKVNDHGWYTILKLK